MTPIKPLLHNAGQLARKYAPEILTGAGIVANGVGTFLACKTSYHLDEYIHDDNAMIEKIKNTPTDGSLKTPDGKTYTEKDQKEDLTKAKVNRAKTVVKHYLPAGLCLLGGTGMICTGTGILHNRNVVTAGALTAIEESFRHYRNNVTEKLGKEADKMFRLNGHEVEHLVEKIDEETGEVECSEPVKKKEFDIWEDNYDPAVLYFNRQTCPNTYTGDMLHDAAFLKNMQATANDRLHYNRNITKNEICDLIGHLRMDDGMILGYVINGDGDGYVDFGIFNRDDGELSQTAIDFYAVHGYFALDLNLDGSIYGKLKRPGNVA